MPGKIVGNFPQACPSFFPCLGRRWRAEIDCPRSEALVTSQEAKLSDHVPNKHNGSPTILPQEFLPPKPSISSRSRHHDLEHICRPPANCLPLDLLFQIGACTAITPKLGYKMGNVHPAASCTLSSFSSMLDSFVHSSDDSFNNTSHLGCPPAPSNKHTRPYLKQHCEHRFTIIGTFPSPRSQVHGINAPGPKR